MSQRIQLRRDTAANWASADPVLAQGELGVVLDAADGAPDTKRGDGVTAWSALGWWSPGGAAASVAALAAETARAEAAEALLAPLASPALTGAPTAPTVSAGDNSTKLATTAYADNSAAAAAGSKLAKAANLSDLANVATARTNLGLGTAATQPATAFVQSSNGGQEVVSTITGATGNVALNLASGNVFSVTMANSAAVTLSFTGAAAGVSCSFTLYLIQGTTGAATVTWPSGIVWMSGGAPSISPTGGAVMVLVFESLNAGVTWYGSVVSGAPSLAQLDARYAALTNANTFTGNQTAPALVASGLTGATATSRYVGATVSGAPTSGSYALGDFVIDHGGAIWICTTAGTASAGAVFKQAGASTGLPLASNSWDPTDNGFVTSCAIPPYHFTGSVTSSFANTGVMYFWRMPIRTANTTLNNLLIGAGNPATGAASTGTFGAFFNSSGTRIAVSNETGAATFGNNPANGLWTIPMTGPFTAQPPWIYGVLLVNMSGSTTQPTMATTGNNAESGQAVSLGLSAIAGDLQFAVSPNNTNVSIPTSFDLTTLTFTNARSFFAAAS